MYDGGLRGCWNVNKEAGVELPDQPGSCFE